MRFILQLAVFIAVLGLSYGQVPSLGKCPKVNVQQNFDINQYMGRWYEMQRFFAIFQISSDCVSADYQLQDSGLVRVNNTGYSKLKRGYTTAIGTAKIMDPNEPAKLGVKFFDGQPYGDYWVLSTDYKTYSVVWSCSEVFFRTFNTQFAWILTRDPAGISDSKRDELIKMMEDYGIKTKHFSRTNQSNCP
ncbi:hypothetical protein ACF0H5_019344 [Mactra antiquata]